MATFVPFQLSTKGKSANEKDFPEEEAVYKSLAEASQGCFSIDEVRIIRRLFDRADEDGNRFVDTLELRTALKNLHENVATRVIEEILTDSDSESKWSFPAFVHMMRRRLTSDERIHLIAMEEEYIRSMGIDDEEKESLVQFRTLKEERRASAISHKRSAENSYSGEERLPAATRRQSVPNDVEEYRREFGLE
jgi:Ca2+-binding EF-hand superfamily protein